MSWVQSLFELYRVDPPRSAKCVSAHAAALTRSPIFWCLGMAAGAAIHVTDAFGLQSRRERDDEVDWRRKGLWSSLALVCMVGPTLACFSKIRRNRKPSSRRNLTATQKTCARNDRPR